MGRVRPAGFELCCVLCCAARPGLIPVVCERLQPQGYANFLGEVVLNLGKLVPYKGQYIDQLFYIKQGKTIMTDEHASGNLKLGLRLDIPEGFTPAAAATPVHPPPPTGQQAANRATEQRAAQGAAETQAAQEAEARKTAVQQRRRAEEEEAQRKAAEEQEQSKPPPANRDPSPPARTPENKPAEPEEEDEDESMLKLTDGSEVPAAKIEAVLKKYLDAVEHVMVVGSGKEFLSCMLTLKTKGSEAAARGEDPAAMGPAKDELAAASLAFAQQHGSEATTVLEARTCSKFRGEGLLPHFTKANGEIQSSTQQVLTLLFFMWPCPGW